MGLFYIAVTANLLNLLHIPLLIPESLSKEARAPKKATPSSRTSLSEPTTLQSPLTGSRSIRLTSFFGFMRPLLILSPRKNHLGDSDVRTAIWDVDLTLLGVSSFCSFLLNVKSHYRQLQLSPY